MPSYALDLRDPQTILRILVCLIESTKAKELQFWAEDYDTMSHGKVLLVDYQRRKGLISLRVTSDNGAAIPVQPENMAWTQPPQSAPLERARAEATRQAQRVSVPSDEELADLENEMKKRQELARLEAEGKAPLRIHTKQ
jgi:hypothetical protein